MEEVDVVMSMLQKMQPRNGPTAAGAQRRRLSGERAATSGDARVALARLRAQEVRRQRRAGAPRRIARIERIDGRGVVSQAQSYLRIPRC